MKIRVISSREEIPLIMPNETMVHMAFRPSNQDIFNVIQACPKVEVIQLPKSYKRTVAKSILIFLEMQRIELIEGDVWGHRKDISEHYNISPACLDKIKEMRGESKSYAEIVVTCSRQYKLAAEMVEYILSKC